MKSAVVFCFLFFSSVAHAVDFSATYWLKSQYVGANGAVFEDRPVAQVTVVASGERCSASLWASTTREGWKARAGDELDYNIWCSWGSVTMAASYYDLSMPGGVSDLNLRYGFGEWWIKTSWFKTFELSFPGGTIAAVGHQGWSAELGEWNLTISPQASYDFGAFGFEEGVIGKVSTTLSNEKVTFGVEFSDGITVGDRGSEVVFWVSQTF